MTFKFCSVCVFLLLLYHTPLLDAKKKIVKLIVPQKVKYIHHTHVLLVRPSYSKKSPVIREEYIEEIPYREESMPIRSKSKIRYITPYYAESKKMSYRLPLEEQRLAPEDLEMSYVPSYLDSYRHGIPHEVRMPHRNEVQIEEVMEESRDGWTKPASYRPSYRMPSLEEEPPGMSAVAEYHTIPTAVGNDYSMRDSYRNLDSFPHMDSYATMRSPLAASDEAAYTKSPIPDWNSYAYSSMDMENGQNWTPSKLSKKEPVYRFPYQSLESGAKTYKLQKGGISDESRMGGSYGVLEDENSYYRGRTDSYGRIIVPPASSFDASMPNNLI